MKGAAFVATQPEWIRSTALGPCVSCRRPGTPGSLFRFQNRVGATLDTTFEEGQCEDCRKAGRPIPTDEELIERLF